MTESLLQNIEEKVMSLLMELETMRRELHHLRNENSSLKTDKANATKKLQGLLSLFDLSAAAPQQTLTTNELEVLHG